MGKLEDTLLNSGKGFASGLTAMADPVGATIAGVDYGFAGIGPADKARNNDTFYNHIHERLYSDHASSQDLKTSYVPRAVGNILGSVGGAAIGYALWTGVSPVAALAVPALTGLYGLVRGGIKYAKNFLEGEKVGENFEKGSFFDGFKFGWHAQTSYLASVMQPWESLLSGRGYDTSKVEGSTSTHAAKGARRNFSSMAGSFFGRVVGEAVNVATLLITPLYKTVRDGIRSVEGKKTSKNYSPSFVSAEPL